MCFKSNCKKSTDYIATDDSIMIITISPSLTLCIEILNFMMQSFTVLIILFPFILCHYNNFHCTMMLFTDWAQVV